MPTVILSPFLRAPARHRVPAPAMEFVIIIVALAINAFFAMSEIGLVSASKARLKSLSDDGNAAARRALALIETPSRFLSTVQVGITFAGIIGAIYGGAALGDKLAPHIAAAGIPWVSAHAQTVAEGILSALIGALSIIFGELVPKRFALLFPDAVALFVSGPMLLVSSCASPVVRAFSLVADGVLRLFGLKKSGGPDVSEDEVRMLIDQGMATGVFHAGERDMVEGVLSLDRLNAGGLMTPRARVIWLNINDADEANWRKVAGSGHTYFPVHDGNPDRVIGTVTVKAMWANLALAGKAEIRNLVTPALTVPMSMTATKLLEMFKRERRHMALVTDDFGTVRGLVTLNDVLESIVGDIPTDMKAAAGAEAHKRTDGSWLVDGLMEVGALKELLDIRELPGEGRAAYHTLAGFILFRLGRIPKPAEKLECSGWVFEIVDLDGQRIDKVLITEAD
jgi:putative hemolysin